MAQYNTLIRHHNQASEAEIEREDYRAALICSSILNTIPRTKKTKDKVYLPGDIFPSYDWGEKKKPPTAEELKQKFRVFNAAMGGREIKRDG